MRRIDVPNAITKHTPQQWQQYIRDLHKTFDQVANSTDLATTGHGAAFMPFLVVPFSNIRSDVRHNVVCYTVSCATSYSWLLV